MPSHDQYSRMTKVCNISSAPCECGGTCETCDLAKDYEAEERESAEKWIEYMKTVR